MSRGWIGVDLDGTLAVYNGWDGGKIGAPVPAMVERVKTWLREGNEVRIFTARVSVRNRDTMEMAEQLIAIQAWCRTNLGQALKVTCEKDFAMVELWDDRCHPVEPNTGRDLLERVQCKDCTRYGDAYPECGDCKHLPRSSHFEMRKVQP